MTTSQGSKDPLPKSQIFERSYDEVLAALKHQDDKLNRTLTALAFLTAAGVSLFTQFGKGPAQVAFHPGGASVTAVLFVVFLFAVALALITALAAIGPGDALKFKSHDADRPLSLIYFGAIAADSQWDKRIGCDEDDLTRLLAMNFHAEARTLSDRVRYKMARSRESGAFLQVAVVALGTLGIFQARAGLGIDACWWIATALLLVSLALPLWDARQMNRYDYGEVDTSHAVYWLVGAVLVFAAIFLGSGGFTDTRWPALAYAGGVLVLSRLAIAHNSRAMHIMLASLVLAIVPAAFLVVDLA